MDVSLTGPVPVSDTSPMFLPAALPGAAGSVVLGDHGYVEEEFFLSGRAAVYDYDDGGHPVVVRDPRAYTTRLIVRRPADAARASGIVHLEVLNPSAHYDLAFTWPLAWPSIVRRGHTWIGVTCKPTAVASLQRFNPARYAPLAFDDLGLVWDVLADVGAVLHDPDHARRLGLGDVVAVFASGWSQTGSFLRTFLAEGFHDRARERAGGPPYDGYLIGISAGGYVYGYSPLNSDAGPELVDAAPRARRRTIPDLDPRRVIQPRDVPVIEFITEAEALENWLGRRPDSDEPGDRYRCYEVPGRGHRAASMEPARQIPVEQMRSVGFESPVHPGITPARSADRDHDAQWLVSATLDHLRAWVVDGVAPPRADPIVVDYRAGKRALTDRFGNARGGVRTPFFTVPLAAYRSVTPDEPLSEGPATAWEEVPFTREQALALYGSKAEYLDRFAVALDQAIAARWYLPDDRAAVLAAAADLADRVIGD